ncbi:unnamed protein product [Wickerhamomyces anomalus]
MSEAIPKRDVLPGNVKPVHYDLEVSNIQVNNNSFEGKVKIELDIKEDTDQIVLHALDIKFKQTELSYSVTKTESVVEIKQVSYDSKAQTATIQLGETLKAGPSIKAYLTIIFDATLRDNMGGFYKSTYKDINGNDQVLLSTQFEAIEARTAFPCFDEPNLKATFSFSITVAEDYTALSNTPVLSSKVLDDGKKKGAVEASGLKLVKFQKTPIMSTYLVAWIVGKLDYVESTTERSYNGKKIPVRVYTSEGNSAKGKFGLEVATKVVDYFSEVFDIDYYLPKLDLIAVPTFASNAMENTALITFRASALLFDEASSDPKYKAKVAYVVSHELAHQWFGNLVTMDWWDELWLNEGFATWVGFLAVDKLYPEWNTFATFSSSTLQTALELDALRGSHPIEVPIQSASDIDQVFDHISYNKGGSVIHQLASTLGIDVFLKGVSHYLKKHQYGNATTNDLWSSVGEVSGVDVNSLADNWVRKIGFPYVEVKVENGNVNFKQNRFLSTGDVTEEENGTNWWIPLNISTGKEDSDRIKDLSFSEKEATIENLAKENTFFKVNKNSVGVYRVKYDDETFKTIVENIDKLSSTDKVGLIADSTVLSVAGLSKTSKALDLISAFKGESEYVTWLELIKRLGSITSVWFEQSEEVQAGLKKLAQELVSPTALSLGFESSSSQDFLNTQLRVELLSAAVSAGVPQIVEEAKSLFTKLQKNEEIDPSLKSVIFAAVISDPNATDEDFKFVYDTIKNSKALDSNEIALTALGTVTNPDLIQKALNLILDPEIPIMDVSFISISLSSNKKARWAFWNYLKENYDAIYNRLNANRIVFDRFIKFTLGKFSSDEAYEEIKSFFASKNTYGFERSIDQVLDGIKTNSSWVSRDKDDVREWLNTHGYI